MQIFLPPPNIYVFSYKKWTLALPPSDAIPPGLDDNEVHSIRCRITPYSGSLSLIRRLIQVENRLPFCIECETFWNARIYVTRVPIWEGPAEFFPGRRRRERYPPT